MILLFLLFASTSALAGEPFVVAVGGSLTLDVADLARAAVADGKVARVRAVPPKQIFVTGLIAGRTQITAWNGSGKTFVYDIEVIESRLYRASLGDGPLPVVKVELEFLELDASEGARLGLKWPELVEGTLAATARGDGVAASASYAASLTSAKTVLEALVTEGRARVLARPRLYVRLGEVVSFLSGGEFPVATSSEKEGHRYPKVEWKPFGLSVKVKPESADGVHLSSDIDVDISEADGSSAIDGVPSLTRRKLTTKMESRDGETVVLSGLIRRVSSHGKEGIPILGSIPILGILFSRTRDTSADSEILIALSLSFRTQTEQDRELGAARQRLGAAP